MQQVLIAIALIVASYLISASMVPKPVEASPAGREDFDFPQTEDGTPQCVIFGDVWVSDWTILDLCNFRTTAIEKDSGGKK